MTNKLCVAVFIRFTQEIEVSRYFYENNVEYSRKLRDFHIANRMRVSIWSLRTYLESASVAKLQSYLSFGDFIRLKGEMQTGRNEDILNSHNSAPISEDFFKLLQSYICTNNCLPFIICS